ncbi:MAG: hypothetical protein IPP79_16035 [Chitinophagaceae bacterium]|nr:hypothetical protein [Chitinophagaceae bacterium]
MKRILILCFSIFFGTISLAQKETYDIVNYTAPKGWKNEVKNNLTSYSSTNSKNNTWCQIFIVKSGVSKGNIDDDFNSDWQDFAVKNYKPTDAPQVSETKEADGWKIKSGVGGFVFNNTNALVLVTTFSGYNRCVSVVAATNSTDYQKDIEDFLTSLDLAKQETGTQEQKTVSAPFVGAWGKSNTVSQINNRFGNYSYNKQQYTFNADGTYRFLAKTYDEKDAETFLIKEKGSYVLKGNSITLIPTSSVIEAWSKKNGGDNWNTLRSSQNRPLETVTYQFSKADNNLLLQTEKQTQRDGKFNTGNTYSYGPPGTFTPISLPEGDTFMKEIIKTKTDQQVSASPKNNNMQN